MEGFQNCKKIILTAVIFLFCLSLTANAVSFSDAVNFYVEKDFDAQNRSQVSAVLVKTSPKLYFYIEKDWWSQQNQDSRNSIILSFDSLSKEFESNIYPILTSVFGSEWSPGVDGDNRITVLFHPMTSAEGGYFRTADEYVKLQLPSSNEREMFYVSVDLLGDQKLKSVLAHEFMHLITFNQKNKILEVDDEVWLNEARADYSSTILGYDDQYSGSNLQARVKDFVESPSDSITEWRGTKYDYASVSLFSHYLMDHYGINIFIDSLKSKYVGIESINYALDKNGYKERFSDIFTDWTITVVVNDCSLGPKYCYLNKNLKNFKLTPNINFLPVSGDVSLTVSNVTKNWAGSWQKFIGGNGDFNLAFSSLKGLSFKVPYIVETKKGQYSVNYIALDEREQGEININGFGTDYSSLIIIPSLQTKTFGFDGMELTFPFTYTVSIKGKTPSEEQSLIQQLLEQIEYLKNQIALLTAQLGQGGGQTYCQQLNSNLYFGMSNGDVKCLQEFLKNQGSNIYPEGLVTGYFGSLTKAAVVRFQEKYASEILNPLGLYFATGFVGPSTRNKINGLIF